MLALGVRQTGSGICQIAAVLQYAAVAINRDPDTALQLGYGDPDPVDHRNSADDSTGDDDRFGFLVDDGSGRMPVPAQGIEDIRADGRSLAVRKRKNLAGYTFPLEGMIPLDNDAGLRIHARQKRDRRRAHQQFPGPDTPGDAASGNYQNNTYFMFED